MDIAFQQWGDSRSLEQILLIHGWGMNSGVWSDIGEYLEQLYPQKSIISVDLPGYGRSVDYSIEQLGGEYTSHSLAKSLAPLLQGKQTTLIAWSMGGLVALELLANQCRDISRLILVSSSPRFVQADDWHYAVEAKVFEGFSQELSRDHHAALKRFLAIQALGSRSAKKDIKILQKHLLLRGEPDPKALESGLQILLTEDKRLQLKEAVDLPVALISGTRDTLIAYQGQKQLAGQENISLFAIALAGHAPFISHPDEFKQILKKVI